MIVAKVAAPNTQDRFFKIEPGIWTVGSDLECNVVLLDAPVLPHHLTLHAGDAEVEVEVPEGAQARIEHAQRKRTTDLKGGDRVKWYAGDRLHIQDVVLELEGVGFENVRQDGPRARKAGRRGLALCCVSAFFMLVPAGAGSGLVPDAGNRAAVSASVATQEEGVEVTPAPRLPTPAEIRQHLEALGARPDRIAQQDGSWSATFYVADLTSRQNLAERLSVLDFPVAPTIYVDEQLKEAAAITLANLSDGAKVAVATGGRLTLSLVPPDKQARIRAALLRDVPGITDVNFGGGQSADSEAIRANVTGLWHGRYPYVVLADQTVVRPGQKLSDGATLLAVSAEYLLVKIGDVETKVYLP